VSDSFHFLAEGEVPTPPVPTFTEPLGGPLFGGNRLLQNVEPPKLPKVFMPSNWIVKRQPDWAMIHHTEKLLWELARVEEYRELPPDDKRIGELLLVQLAKLREA